MRINLKTVVPGILAVMLLICCRREFDRLVPVREYNDAADVNVKAQKILYIIVDGARGLSVRDAKTPVITALTSNATYSWYSLSDDNYSDATAWTDMLTGVSKEKHRVRDMAFTDENLSQYPTVIKRIKTARPATRVTAFSSSPVFTAQLTEGADQRMSLATDAEVKQAVVQELAVDTTGVILGHFSSVKAAGESSGYDLSFQAYRQAIIGFDSYLGEMIAAVKARKTYSRENWLIIVTSGKGGDFAVTPGDNTIFSNGKMNTFTIFSNISYGIRYIDKPYTGNRYDGSFLRMYGTGNDAIKAEIQDTFINRELLNFGDTTSFTLEFKVKKENRGTGTSPNYDYAAPAILSKKPSKAQKTGLGWAISLETRTWQIGFGKPTENSQAVKGSEINDGNWHSLAVVVGNRGDRRYVRTFTDGNFNAELLLPVNWGPIDYPASSGELNPLTLGFIPGETTNPFNGYVSELKIWLAAVPDTTIKKFTCDPALSSVHPFRNRLAGYWPCKEGSGGRFKDNGAARADFVLLKGDIPLENTAQWSPLSALICPVAATDLAKAVPVSRDIAAQILSWLAIPPADTWKLDGRAWLNQ